MKNLNPFREPLVFLSLQSWSAAFLLSRFSVWFGKIVIWSSSVLLWRYSSLANWWHGTFVMCICLLGLFQLLFKRTLKQEAISVAHSLKPGVRPGPSTLKWGGLEKSNYAAITYAIISYFITWSSVASNVNYFQTRFQCNLVCCKSCFTSHV